MPVQDANSKESREERVRELFDGLRSMHMSQKEIAAQLNVPPQYLSDVKTGRRPLTGQFAQRIADVFRVNYSWLMKGQGSAGIPVAEKISSTTSRLLGLPVLSSPVEGDPHKSKSWDGSLIEISGAAAARAAWATQPYVLRLDKNDFAGRLKKGDMVLVSQDRERAPEVAILKHQSRLELARRGADGTWKTLVKGQTRKDPDIIGACVVIVWAPLDS